MIAHFLFSCIVWQLGIIATKGQLNSSQIPTNSPTNSPTRSPSTRSPTTRTPTSASSSKGLYSNVLFLGDSLIARWLCFTKGGVSPLYPSAECGQVIATYFDTSSNLDVHCTNSLNYYCKSAFQSAFRDAITFAVRGYTIDDVTNRIRTYQPLQLLSSGSIPGANIITTIIIEVGTNNFLRETPVTTAQFIAGASLQPLIVMYNTMLTELNIKFPSAKVLLLSVTPHNTDYSVDNRYRDALNQLLKFTYTNSSTFPYVKFTDITQYFMWPNDPGNVVFANYVDMVHFSAKGYGRFETAIKDSLKTL